MGITHGRLAKTDRYTRTSEERFWAFVDKRGPDECWLWLGMPHNSPWHGRIKIDGVAVWAHRYSWELVHGQLQTDQKVLHTCDVPKCVNPRHLFIGTQADNIVDMNFKGRARGGASKLSPELVRYIRKEIACGRTQNSVESEMNLSAGTVSRVVNRKIWAWVSDEEEEEEDNHA